MRMKSEPGVYASETEGHILVLKYDPFSVTCVVCAETCARGTRSVPQFSAAATEFVAKHGYLGERLADNLLQLLEVKDVKS